MSRWMSDFVAVAMLVIALISISMVSPRAGDPPSIAYPGSDGPTTTEALDQAWFEFDLVGRSWTAFGVLVENGGTDPYQTADPPCLAAPHAPTTPPKPPPRTVKSTALGVLTPNPCNPPT